MKSKNYLHYVCEKAEEIAFVRIDQPSKVSVLTKIMFVIENPVSSLFSIVFDWTKISVRAEKKDEEKNLEQ